MNKFNLISIKIPIMLRTVMRQLGKFEYDCTFDSIKELLLFILGIFKKYLSFRNINGSIYG